MCLEFPEQLFNFVFWSKKDNMDDIGVFIIVLIYHYPQLTLQLFQLEFILDNFCPDRLKDMSITCKIITV